MSSRHASLLREGADFATTDLDSRNGTRVNGESVAAPTLLADGDFVQVGHTILRYRAAVATPVGEPADVDSSRTNWTDPLVTIDPSLAHRAAALGRVARSVSPVLLLGETGAGKEVLARAIHRLSGRTGPFVAINCGALPGSLLESQLFGHVQGAFSGATKDAPGLLRSGNGGTVLLDEIGDLPEPAQAALLRALQEHEILPVGGVRPVKVDLRILAATHRPLEKLVQSGGFRADLFARLAAFVFCLPALRSRAEDIGLLVAEFAREQSISFTTAAGRAVLSHDWPLNVRELYQALEIAKTLAGGGIIDLPHLPSACARHAASPRDRKREPSADDPLRETLIASLARHNGNISAVARDLGKARMQVQRWIQRFHIDASSFREGGRD
jgi:transcriptional regulator with PAS, ATPase and Fis domain